GWRSGLAARRLTGSGSGVEVHRACPRILGNGHTRVPEGAPACCGRGERSAYRPRTRRVSAWLTGGHITDMVRNVKGELPILPAPGYSGYQNRAWQDRKSTRLNSS